MTDPQYDLTVMLNGTIEHEQKLDDPFVTTTTTIPIDDLRRLADLGEDVSIVMRVSGTRAALAHVFKPMDLAPNNVTPATIEGAEEAAQSACERFHPGDPCRLGDNHPGIPGGESTVFP